jgi:tetratricopeptide (TPR) repeat protein
MLPLLAQEIPGVPPESEYYYRIHYERVEKMMALPDPADREKQLTDFMKGLNPKSKILQFMPSFFNQIVEAYQKAGKAAQAKALQDKMVQMFPNTGNPMAPIVAAFKANDFAKTLELGEKLYATNSNRELAYLLFESAVQTNNPAKAEPYAVKVADEFGPKDGIKAATWLARYYVQQKNVDKAATYAAMMISAFPDAPPPGFAADYWKNESIFARALMGDAAYRRKDYKAAIAAYEDVLKLDSKNDYAYFRIGYNLWQLQDLDKAQEAFAKAVVLGKSYAAKAREYLEQIYKPRHNNSLDGLDQMLAKAKAEVNP